MATVKKIKKAAAGAVCGPGDGDCRWGSKSPFSRGKSGAPKQKEWKSPKIKFGRSKDEEPEPPKKSKPVYPAKGKPSWHPEWDFDESIPRNLKSGFYRDEMKKGGKVSKKAAPKKMVKKVAPKAKSGYKTSKKKK